MVVELDHVFVCAAAGAPEAERLTERGFREGPPNRHPGQGTANRRFFFANSMLELLFVTDPAEARSARTAPTKLWERWSGRQAGACPFGICFRPTSAGGIPPFPGWQYRPEYLPEPLFLQIGDAGIEEPMWIFGDFMARSIHERHFAPHPIGAREITRVVLTTPVPLRSAAAQWAIESGVVAEAPGPEYGLEVEFDSRGRDAAIDLRPQLPLVLRI